MAKCGWMRVASLPGRLGDPEGLEHRLGPEPPRSQRHGSGAVRRQLVAERERRPEVRGLGQVVEERHPVVLVVVAGRSVGHLDHQPPGLAYQQGQREVGRDRMGVDGQAQQVQPVVEVRFPHRGVPLHLRGAPDVVDQDVQRVVLGPDAADQRGHLAGIEVVDLDGDPRPARRFDQLGCLLDRLWSVHLRPLGTRRPPRAVHRGAGCAQLDRDPPSGAPRRAGDQRNAALQRLVLRRHAGLPRSVLPPARTVAAAASSGATAFS